MSGIHGPHSNYGAHGPRDPTPYDPNKGPPTMPSLSGANPPSQADVNATNNYLSAMMQWDARLQSPFKGYNQIDHTTYENLVAFIKNLQNQITGTKTSAALQTMMDQVKAKCLNPPLPTPDQKQAQQILTQAQALANKYISLLQGLISQLSKYSVRIASDLKAIAHWLSKKSSSTDPQGLANALAKSTAELNGITADNPYIQKNIKQLNELIKNTNATLNNITKDASEIDSHPGDSSQNAPLLADMKKLCATIPEATPPKPSSKFARQITKFDGLLSSAETGIVNARKTYLPKDPPPPLPPGQMYLDINYLKQIFSNPPASIDAYIDKCKAAGIKTLDLAFGGLNDIDNLLNNNPDPIAGGDPLLDWLNANPKALGTLTAELQKNNMTLDISFGGQNANSWDMPPSGPVQGAKNLAAFMKKYNIGSVDFDIESNIFGTAITKEECIKVADTFRQFFTTLHANLGPGQKSMLTPLAGPDNNINPPPLPSGEPDPKNPPTFTKGIWFLFFNDDMKTHCFTTMFDGLNIMTYQRGDPSKHPPGGNYFLLDKAPGWNGLDDIMTYINLLGGGTKAADMIHFGFTDLVDYSHDYTGGKDPVNASSNGAAAAMQFERLLEALKAKGIDGLGGVFFWPDADINPFSADPNMSFETQFWTELNRWNQLNGGTQTSQSNPSLDGWIDLPDESGWDNDLNPPTRDHRG